MMSGHGSALDGTLVRMAVNGQRPRCGDWRADNPWLSDDPRDRAAAAALCVGCPVLVECGLGAVELRATFGVWGGRDRAPRARQTEPERERNPA